MSDAISLLVILIIAGALMVFFFGAARAAGRPVPRKKRTVDDSGPFVGPWGILESRKRDRDLEWDEIAIMDDEHRLDEEDDERDWLDQPGDDFGSGWTNFDYIAAEELEDDWDGED